MKNVRSPRRIRSSQSLAKRRRLSMEALEERILLSDPTVAISGVAISLGPPGPASISGTLTPATATQIYRIGGVAGERLAFHSISTTSTQGSWALFGLSNQQIAGAALGKDFTANLTADGTYDLEVIGNDSAHASLDFKFQVTDASDVPVTASGFNTPRSGTLAAGASALFTFAAPAGLMVEFNSLVTRGGPITAVLSDPTSHTVFSDNGLYNAGPYALTSAGTYALTLTNHSASSSGYGFNLLSLTAAAQPLTLGAVTSGTIATGYGLSVYSFSGAAGERLYFDNQQDPGDLVDLSMVGPDGLALFSVNNSIDPKPITLTQDGRYSLIVDNESGSAIHDQFKLSDTAYSPLEFGTPVSAGFIAATATDSYRFEGAAGEHVTFENQAESNGYYGYTWTLYGPNNQAITTNWAGVDLLASLPVDGSYTLVLENYSYYGASSYSFEGYLNSTPVDPISLGQEITGTVANPGDTHRYTFTGSPGQQIAFDGLDSSSGADVQITDPLGNNLLSASYHSVSSDFGPFTLSAAGVYTVTVSNPGHSTGGYDFRVDDLAASSSSLPLGAPFSDSLATGLTSNLYHFSGTADERLYLASLSVNPSFTANWTLYGPDGQPITSTNLESDQTAILPSAGNYTLAVQGDAANLGGPVDFAIEVYQEVTATAPLTLGTEVTGSLANPGDRAVYTFTGSVGQQVDFDGLDSSSGIDIQITDPLGNNFFYSSQSVSSDYGPITLSAAGTYTVTVFGEGRETGGYDFRVDDLAASSSILLLGAPFTGSLATGLTSNFYQFSGTAGERLYLASQSVNPSSTASWTLYGPDGQSITSTNLDYDQIATLPNTGTYTLAIQGETASLAGPVDFTIEAYPAVTTTAPVTFGTEVTGTLANPGDQALYMLTGAVGRQLYLDGLDSSSGIDVQITDPLGNNILSSYDQSVSIDFGPLTLSAAGTYIITVFSQGRETGGYDFRVDDLAAAASSLPLGVPSADSLATGLTTNLYRFSGTAGERLYLSSLSVNPSSSASWTLYGPSGQWISAVPLDYDQIATLPTNGTYTLAVQGDAANLVGPVDFTIEVSQTATSTAPLTLGNEVTGSLANPGDRALYTFTGSVGQQIYLDGLDSSSGIDVQLTDPLGSTFFYYYNQPVSSDFGPLTLSAAGTYAVTVFGQGRSTGDYDFRVDDIAASSSSLPLGVPFTDSLTTGLTSNFYQFSGIAGERLYLASLSVDPSFTAYWTLYGPDGRTITNTLLDFDQTATLPTTGTYTLAVQGYTANLGGPVNFTIQVYQAMTTTASLSLGAVVSGSLANPGDQALFTFTGSAGQQIYLDSFDPATGVDVQITDPLGNNVLAPSNPSAGSDYGPFTLSAAGTYTVTVFGQGRDTGGYDFAVLDASAQPLVPTSTPITVPGTLSSGAAATVYQVAGTAGEILTLQGDPFLSGSATWTLYDPRSNQIDGTSLSADLTLTLPWSGPYILVLSGQDDPASPIDFSFNVSATEPDVTPTGFNLEQSGTIIGNSATIFSFAAPAGLAIFYNSLLDRDFSSTLSATLTDPDGNTIFSGNGTINEGAFVLTSSGYCTLTLINSSDAPVPFDFSMLSLGDAAEPLSLGAVTGGSIDPGYGAARLQLQRHRRRAALLRQPAEPGRPGQLRALRTLQQPDRRRRFGNRRRPSDLERFGDLLPPHRR